MLKPSLKYSKLTYIGSFIQKNVLNKAYRHNFEFVKFYTSATERKSLGKSAWLMTENKETWLKNSARNNNRKNTTPN